MTPAGLPHSEIHGSQDACSSPWLIAACRVLLRLPAPRHPPCALTALDQFASLTSRFAALARTERNGGGAEAPFLLPSMLAQVACSRALRTGPPYVFRLTYDARRNFSTIPITRIVKEQVRLEAAARQPSRGARPN